MKIILSRKGFDSSVGGYPSPVLPNGMMLSLPIPTSIDSLRYEDIAALGGKNYREIIAELRADRALDGKGAHLDPDLLASVRTRAEGWRPSLGQIDSAAGHLRNQHVAVGDLFLFYGWFRRTELTTAGLRYASEPGFHAIYGYLQIGKIFAAGPSAELPAWLRDHPHALPRRRAKESNAIYAATDRLGICDKLPGAGAFRFTEALILSKRGMTRACWDLDPSIFRHLRISYHTVDAWKDGYFKSYPRAQEYVIDADQGAIAWAADLIWRSATQNTPQ